MAKKPRINSAKVVYNPNNANSDLNFQNWYKTNTLEGKNGIPFDINKLDYDYYSFYRNNDQGNIDNHFPDTYKLPKHETFSNESLYSGNGYKGSWDGSKFIKLKKGGKIPEYGLGSTIGGLLGTVAGTAIAPGLGTGLGSIAGSYLGSLFDNREPVDIKPIQNNTQPLNPTSKELYGSNTEFYAVGGMVNQPAEVEKEEVARTPDGNTIMFDGPSHDNGGIQTMLPLGTEITSDRLTNPKTGNTFAKDQKRIETNKNNLNKRLELRPNDSYIKSSIGRGETKSQQIFDLQEEMKQNMMLEDHMDFLMCGGTLKYKDGGIHIKPSKRGSFTKWAKSHGMGVQEAATHVMANKDNYSSSIIKKANFAKNAAGFKHPEGGYISPKGLNYLDVDLGSVPPLTPSTNTSNSTYNPYRTPSFKSNQNWFDRNASMLGLGIGAAGLGSQFIDSFNQDPITRIQNPYRDMSLNTMRSAIDKQRNLSYDVSDQLRDLDSSERGTNRWIDTNLAGPSATASRLANRAISLRGRNSIYGDRNRANVGIQSTANQMLGNLGEMQGRLGSEQASYDNIYQDQNLRSRANNRRNRYASLSNFGNIFQQYGRDKAMQRRDEELMYLLPYLYPNANIPR